VRVICWPIDLALLEPPRQLVYAVLRATADQAEEGNPPGRASRTDDPSAKRVFAFSPPTR
jgi:hypothetical protein